MSRGQSKRAVRTRANVVGLTLVLVVAVLATPVALLAHAHLKKSVPSAADSLEKSPSAVTLWFSEAPELAFTKIVLLGADSAAIALGDVRRLNEDPLAVSASIRSPLVPGKYIVVWQTAASDGHPSRGRFSFRVLPSRVPTPVVSDTQTNRAGPRPPAPSGEESQESIVESPADIAVRWVSFVALLAMVGVAAFCWLVLPRMISLAHAQGGSELGSLRDALPNRLARAGIIAAGALFLAALLRLWLEAAAMHVTASRFDMSPMGQMVMHTGWGTAWLIQANGALIAMIALGLTRQTRDVPVRSTSLPWVVATAAIVAVAFTPALGGHAAASPRLTGLAVLFDGLHVIGAGGWLGALLVLLLVGVPVALSVESAPAGSVIRDLVNAFSPAALAFAGVVVLTGSFSAWLHLGSFDALWHSTYGRTLLIKLALLIPVLGAGVYNWQRVRPSLGSAEAARRLRRSATVELTIGGLVLLATAVLVAVQTPL